jgi:hypothetical protein
MDNPSKSPALPASKAASPSKTGSTPAPGADHSQMEHSHDQPDH